MKTLKAAIVLLAVISLFTFIGCNKKEPPTPQRDPVIEILPDLKRQVNAETPNHTNPWYKASTQDDIVIKGNLSDATSLARTIDGKYSYTIHRFAYRALELRKGEFPETELTFFIVRRFPTRESGIKVKALWPFRPDRALLFKLRKGEPRYLITSIEIADPNNMPEDTAHKLADPQH